MRSMYTGKFFINAMKKKPHIRAIYEDMDNYTSKEIMEMMSIPMWFRERLCELKDQGVRYSDDLDRQLIEGPPVQETTVHNPVGQVCQYNGEEWELKVGSSLKYNNEFIMIIEDGDWFFILDPKAGEIRHKHSSFFTSQLKEIIDRTSYLGNLTLTEYGSTYQAYVNAKHGIVDDTIVDPATLQFLDDSNRLTTAVSDIEKNFPGVRINK